MLKWMCCIMQERNSNIGIARIWTLQLAISLRSHWKNKKGYVEKSFLPMRASTSTASLVFNFGSFHAGTVEVFSRLFTNPWRNYHFHFMWHLAKQEFINKMGTKCSVEFCRFYELLNLLPIFAYNFLSINMKSQHKNSSTYKAASCFPVSSNHSF